MAKCIYFGFSLFWIFEFNLIAAELSPKDYRDAFCVGRGSYGSLELNFERENWLIGDLMARIANKKKPGVSEELDGVIHSTQIDSENLCELRTFDSKSFLSRLGVKCDDNCIKQPLSARWSIPDCIGVCRDMTDALQKRADYLKKNIPARDQGKPDNISPAGR
jgi:hypothetical protein